MAKIIIDGTVCRVQPNRNGFTVVEEVTSKDKTFKNYFTVWTDSRPQIAVGAKVHVEGIPSASAYKQAQTGDAKASLNVNFPTVTTFDDDEF